MASLLRPIIPARRCPMVGRCLMSTVAHSTAALGLAMPPWFGATPAHSSRPAAPAPPLRPKTDGALDSSMPPGFTAHVAHLDTFKLPERVTGTAGDRAMGKALVDAWRRDGIVQIAMNDNHRQLWKNARAASQRFFKRPHHEKAKCVDAQSYAGYIASGEEITDGIADYSEIFTITKDLGPTDYRVRAKWPCHGPCPWPDSGMKEAMTLYNEALGREGERLLQLIEMGLNVAPESLTRYTRDGWHHTRVLRFPPRNGTNGKGKAGRGIGSHTDYGLLVIAAQDEVGGLFVRRPNKEEKFANWKASAAGLKEDANDWLYVPPVEGVHTVILGDMMQYLTNNYLTATPHKVGLNTRERFSYAYFHEPSFQAVIKPLEEGCGGLRADTEKEDEGIHYGKHFTNMFVRNYPDRITTKQLMAEDRYGMLDDEELRTMGTSPTSF